MSYGDVFLERYEKYFGEIVGSSLLKLENDPSIQILKFQPLDDVRAFFTFGLSHYPDKVGGISEVFLATDDGWDIVPKILGGVALVMVENSLALEHGSSINHVDKIEPEISRTFGKIALYFTNPIGVPDNFGIIHLADNLHGRIYMGCFISAAELDFLAQNGPDKFEDALADADVDPFDIKRPSIF